MIIPTSGERFVPGHHSGSCQEPPKEDFVPGKPMSEIVDFSNIVLSGKIPLVVFEADKLTKG